MSIRSGILNASSIGDSREGADRGRRKAYRSPKLVVYGDIRAITQNVGSKKMPDGGAKPSWKSAL